MTIISDDINKTDFLGELQVGSIVEETHSGKILHVVIDDGKALDKEDKITITDAERELKNDNIKVIGYASMDWFK